MTKSHSRDRSDQGHRQADHGPVVGSRRATPARWGARFVAPIGVVLLGGLLLRLLIAYVIMPGEGLGNDLRLFTTWATTLADVGPAHFYGTSAFADYPPGYLYVLWLLGSASSFIAGLVGSTTGEVIQPLLKLPAILVDVAIAGLLFRALRRWRDERTGLIAAGLYLLVPVTWYDSAVWGQVDAVGALLLLVTVLLLIDGWSEGASGVAMLAALTKPQYAIGLVVVGSVLLGRHLLRRGTGPVPVLPRWFASRSGIAGRIGAWQTEQQGIPRLFTSAATAAVVFIVVTAPFDLPALASNDVAGIPLVGHIAGFVSLLGSAAGYYSYLTANAFNMWSLAGPTPLSHAIGHSYMWTPDTIQVLGPLSASTVGAGLLALLGLAVAVTLLLRDDRWTIVMSLTVLAIGFYALPTRVHERYLFPTFVSGAILAAMSVRWRLWYVAVAVLNAANLHAIMTLPFEGYGTPGTHGMPLATTLREDVAVISIAVGQTVLFGLAFAVFLRTITWPALGTVPAILRSRRGGRRTAAILMARPLTPGERRTHGEHQPVAHVPAPAPGAAVPQPAAPPTSFLAMIASGSVWVASFIVRIASFIVRIVDGITARLPRSSVRDRSDLHAGEPGGRLDRRDLVVVLTLIAVTFGMRAYRLDIPRTEFFDEYWHATTAMEFLQDWEYGIPHTISEWTHPHLAKYVMAAGIVALGDNKVTSTTDIGAPVVDAMLQPVFPDGPGGLLGGDRLVIATGKDIRVAAHGDLAQLRVIALPGASALAADPGADAIYVGTSDGLVIRMDGATLDGSGGPSGTSIVGTIAGPVNHLWATGPGRVIARTGDELTLLDGNAHTVLGTLALKDVSEIVPLTVPGKSMAVASVPSGIVTLDTDRLTSIDSLALAQPLTGMTLVNGSDQGRRNRELLGQPTLYLATGTPDIETIVVAPDGTLSPSGGFPMPGVVTDLRWNETVNMVHALGVSPDGRPTIYVIDPHRNSVFADAPLAFQPKTWLLDAEPRAPTLDRQRALAFAATGSVASIDIGSNAFAWRFPGVVAGALMAGLLFLLTRLLFRRRIIGLLVAAIVPLDGLLFSQSRIAMNDTYVGLFVVASFTLLAWLLRAPPSLDALTAGLRAPWRHRRWELVLGLPLLGLLLGLALASKWVGAYAMGAVILLVLLRSWAGRWLAFAALAGLTALFGHLAVAEAQPNVVFFLVMLLLTALFGVAMVRTGQVRSWSAARADHPDPGWVDPRWRRGIPFLYAMACLTVVPLVVYVASYIPWALSTAGGPQLFNGWPSGNIGQTFADLQVTMYRYHNELRAPHGASSPWWAWPFDLKPVWGYLDSFLDGNGATVLLSGNTFLLWLAIPAAAFGSWQAWRRRSQELAFVVIAFLCLWLPWSRIDRVSFNYHFYAAMPFLFVLLAYFLAELWDGPSPRTWVLARISAVVVLLFPAILWLGRDQLCNAIGGVEQVNPGSIVCNQPAERFLTPVLAWLAGAVIVGLVILLLVRRPRWLVGGMLAVAAGWFLVMYPALAALNVPADWPWIYQGLLPSWDSSFYFNNNQTPVVAIPLLDTGLVATAVVTVAAGLGAMWLAGWRPKRPRRPAPTTGGSDDDVTGGDGSDEPEGDRGPSEGQSAGWPVSSVITSPMAVVSRPGHDPSQPAPGQRGSELVAALRAWAGARSMIDRAAAIVAVIALGMYVATLLPGVSFGDWSEMQSVPYLMGIAHPTGYPVAVLLGKLWSFLPIGSVAYRANLLSAVEVSAAVGLAVLILGRLRVRPVIAAAAALALAAVPTVWEAATSARVDALHLLFVTLIVHRALVWGQGRQPKDLLLLALLTGLSFGNHMLTVAVAPFVAAYSVYVGRYELRRRPALLVLAAIVGAAGLCVYLYIPIRAAIGPSSAFGELATLDGFLYLVRGGEFSGDMTLFSVTGIGNFATHLGDLGALAMAAFPLPLLGISVVGFGNLLRRERAFAAFSAASLLATAYVFVNYHGGDLTHYLLPVWLVLALWTGVAVEPIIHWGSRMVDRLPQSIDSRFRRARTAPALVTSVIVLLAAATLIVSNWGPNDRSRDSSGDDFVNQVLSDLPPGAVLLAYWDAAEPLNYAQCVEGRRPDVLIVNYLNPPLAAQGCPSTAVDVGRLTDPRPVALVSLMAQRPVFAVFPYAWHYDTLRVFYRLTSVDRLAIPWGQPSRDITQDLVRLSAGP